MKYLLSFFVVSALILGCSKPAEHDHHHPDMAEGDDPNSVLYNQVLDVHDEVMPQMDEIERLKRELKEQIANTPDMVVEKKQKLEQVISNLDSAGTAMMDWMHELVPLDELPDSVDTEEARAYYESEMERIKKVKEQMLEAIAKAKTEKGS
ncbi:MAG: hypothetical protein MUC38_15985 [Cyclobacteriaceae bacterium]|jgi:hypothetical protein|nr:hypothetical protein [Cyclobacteriaceae bacterium]